jgi:hypothetical protein
MKSRVAAVLAPPRTDHHLTALEQLAALRTPPWFTNRLRPSPWPELFRTSPPTRQHRLTVPRVIAPALFALTLRVLDLVASIAEPVTAPIGAESRARHRIEVEIDATLSTATNPLRLVQDRVEINPRRFARLPRGGGRSRASGVMTLVVVKKAGGHASPISSARACSRSSSASLWFPFPVPSL